MQEIYFFENKINGVRSQEVWDRLSQSVESGEISAFSAAWEWMNSSSKSSKS